MNSNPNNGQLSGFTVLMYHHFILKKKYRVDDVARDMRIATDTLYRYVRGENVIPPDRVADLIRVTGDVDFLDFFCEPSGYVPVPAVKAKVTTDTLTHDQVLLAILNGEAIKAVDEALRDGTVTRDEARHIDKHLTRLQAKAAELREKIRKEL